MNYYIIADIFFFLCVVAGGALMILKKDSPIGLYFDVIGGVGALVVFLLYNLR